MKQWLLMVGLMLAVFSSLEARAGKSPYLTYLGLSVYMCSDYPSEETIKAQVAWANKCFPAAMDQAEVRAALRFRTAPGLGIREADGSVSLVDAPADETVSCDWAHTIAAAGDVEFVGLCDYSAPQISLFTN